MQLNCGGDLGKLTRRARSVFGVTRLNFVVLFPLKVVASFLESDYFMLAMLDKFDLVDWSRYV